MTITGRMTFTSDKSMEIKVVADVENLLEGIGSRNYKIYEKPLALISAVGKFDIGFSRHKHKDGVNK
jgi:hypothetical protein